MVQHRDLPSRRRRGQGVVEPRQLGGGQLAGHGRGARVEHEHVDRTMLHYVVGAGLAEPAKLGRDLAGRVGDRFSVISWLPMASSQRTPASISGR